jgi:type II secretory pathway pseudopilin PulG
MDMQSAGARGRPAVPGTRLDDGGYIMVVLLIGMAVAAVWMSAALPSWRQQAVREKEAELIFRGEQYARAIFLYRQKNNAPPPNIDALVNGKYLRKKYVDPMTGKDFVPVAGASVTPGPGRGGRGGIGQGQPQVGMTGVRSTSTDTSIILYQNQNVYNQFPFDWTFEAQKAGAMGPVGVQPEGGRGTDGRGGARGGRRGGIEAGRRGAMPLRGGFQRGSGADAPARSGPARGGQRGSDAAPLGGGRGR